MSPHPHAPAHPADAVEFPALEPDPGEWGVGRVEPVGRERTSPAGETVTLPGAVVAVRRPAGAASWPTC